MQEKLKRVRNYKNKNYSTKKSEELIVNPLKVSVALMGTALAVSGTIAPGIAHAAETISTTDENIQTNGTQDAQLTDSEVTLPAEANATTENTSGASVDSNVNDETSVTSESVTSESTVATKTSEAVTTSSTEVPDAIPAAEFALDNMVLAAMAPADFINAVASHAQQVAAANGLYASVMIAQACLESGWGGSTLAAAPNYNLFGIKGNYNGQSVTMRTAEQDAAGNVYYVNAAFRKYPSYAESFADNANVLKNTSFQAGVYFYAGAWKSNAKTYQEATAYLTGRYATDVNYNTKLNNIIATYNLTKYDTGGTTAGATTDPGTSTGSNTTNNSNNNTNNNSTTTNTTNYTVVSGDTLWAIAQKNGISVAELKSLNGLTSDTILVGQTLKLKATGTSSNSNSSSTGNTSNNTATNTANYTVVSGDTLWAIAQKNGTSVAELKSLNGLTSDTILVGQSLKVKSSTGSTTSNSSNSNSTTTGSSTGSSTTVATYKVVSGDTLTSIASRYGTTVAQIKSLNGLTSDVIQVGQSLKVNTATVNTVTNGSTGSTANNTSNTTTATTYKVVSGDTLTAIAAKYGTTVANLKSLNSLSSDLIKVGQTLTIKKGSTVTTTTTAGTYKVVSGDTLWSIAQKNGLSVNSLKSINNLSSDTILIGQTLKLKA